MHNRYESLWILNNIALIFLANHQTFKSESPTHIDHNIHRLRSYVLHRTALQIDSRLDGLSGRVRREIPNYLRNFGTLARSVELPTMVQTLQLPINHLPFRQLGQPDIIHKPINNPVNSMTSKPANNLFNDFQSISRKGQQNFETQARKMECTREFNMARTCVGSDLRRNSARLYRQRTTPRAYQRL